MRGWSPEIFQAPRGGEKLRSPLPEQDERSPSVPFGPSALGADVAQLCPRPASPAHGGPNPRPFPRAGPAHRTSRGGRNARLQAGLRVRGEGPGSGYRTGPSPLPAASSGSAARGGSPLGCTSVPLLGVRDHHGHTGSLGAPSAHRPVILPAPAPLPAMAFLVVHTPLHGPSPST